MTPQSRECRLRTVAPSVWFPLRVLFASRYHEPKKIDKLLEMCKQLYKYREREEFEEEAEMYTAVLKLAYKVPEEEYRKVKAAGRERARAAGSTPYAAAFALPVLLQSD